MENLSVVDPLIEASMTALYTGGSSPSSAINPDTQWALEMGIGGIAEEATKQTDNIIGLDSSGVTMTDSVKILSPQGTCATLRLGISGAEGFEGTATSMACGGEAAKEGQAEFNKKAEKEKSVFDEILTEHLVGGGPREGGHMDACGGNSGGAGGGGGGCNDHGGDANCGGQSHSDQPCPTGYSYRVGQGCVKDGVPTDGGSARPCTNIFNCPKCPSGRRCSEGQCA